MSDLSTDISLKYHISDGIDTILPTESRLAKKSVKSPIFRRNIENFRYFGEISRVRGMCAWGWNNHQKIGDIDDISQIFSNNRSCDLTVQICS